MEKLTFILLLFIPFLFFAQSHKDNFLLEIEIKKVCQGNFTDFHKAHVFFFKKQIDSSFFYSSQAYDKISKGSKIENYLRYIYGVNALDKEFFSIAQKKLEKIPFSFSFKYLVDYSLGAIAIENEEYNKALSYYSNVISFKKILSNNKLKKVYHNIGICYLHLKNYSESEVYLAKELELSEKEKDTLSVIYAKMDLGNLFYQQYKDTQAINYFKEAYDLAQIFSNIRLKKFTAKNMAVVEKNRKRYKESVDYYIEYGKWKDSLWNRDQISKLLEKDKQIAIAKKDKEIFVQDVLAKKQKKNIQLVIGIASVALLLLGILYYFFRIKTKQNQLINTQKDQLEKLNTTKNYLFSVISHDLRSPVNALRKQQSKLIQQIKDRDSTTLEKTANATISLTESMHHLLNNVLHWSLEQNEQLLFSKTTIALQPLIQQVLFDFESLATIKQIEIQTALDATIFINADVESLKIVLRNIIDNAIKYTEEEGRITIRTKVQSKNECCIEIKDSGKGISKAQLAKINAIQHISIDKIDRSEGVGLGLLLCNTLIKKNNGLIAIESDLSKGTTFKITLPLTTNT